MSRIEEMIEEMCPDGVEYKRLEECCNILDSKRKPVKKDSRTGGQYPYYGANGIQDYVDGYLFDGQYVLIGEDGSVMTKDRHPVVNYAEGKIWVNNHAHIIEANGVTLLRYLFHYLQTIDISGYVHGNIPKFTGKDLKSLEIPVPPLQVQEEIVRTLDAFTKLATELATKLAAELAMRTKQYAYYRDELLKLKGVEGVEYKEIAEVSSYEQPGPYIVHSTDYDDEYDTPVLTAGQTFILGYTDETDGIYNASKQQPVILFDDFTGALKWVDFPFKVKSSATKFIKSCDGVMLRYLYYCMCSLDFSSKEHKRLWISKYSHFEIPIPPLQVQQDIVTKLDAFSSYCTDLTSGLPAEIAAREKQYAYYRDIMLSFPVQKNK